jgi:hypothetical protein
MYNYQKRLMHIKNKQQEVEKVTYCTDWRSCCSWKTMKVMFKVSAMKFVEKCKDTIEEEIVVRTYVSL